jgi:hypothetical protein
MPVDFRAIQCRCCPVAIGRRTVKWFSPQKVEMAYYMEQRCLLQDLSFADVLCYRLPKLLRDHRNTLLWSLAARGIAVQHDTGLVDILLDVCSKTRLIKHTLLGYWYQTDKLMETPEEESCVSL